MPSTLHATLSGLGNCACLDGIVVTLTFDATIGTFGGWRGSASISCSTGSTAINIIFHCIFDAMGHYNWALDFFSTDDPPGSVPNCNVTLFETSPGNSCHPLSETANIPAAGNAGLNCCRFSDGDDVTVVITL